VAPGGKGKREMQKYLMKRRTADVPGTKKRGDPQRWEFEMTIGKKKKQGVLKENR